MKPSIFTLIALILISLSAHSQTPSAKIISDYGVINSIPDAEEFPDQKLEYKIVIDIMAGAKSDELNPGLNNIARLLNLHAEGGVSKENIHVVAVIHNKATPTILSNEDYKEHFGIDNPNEALIDTLTNNGVKFVICGQSLLARGYANYKINKNVKLSVSALTALTTYQLKGYAALKFD